jgi:hypothetical protein
MTGSTRIPVACSLAAGEQRDRREAWEELAGKALRGRRATSRGVRLVYADEEGVEAELRELARLEARCCGFAEWRVSRSDDSLVLVVESAGEGVKAVHAMFGDRRPAQM